MPSSVISSFHYDPVKATLRITFVSVLVYDDLDFPAEVYQAFKTSGARGIYLNQHINGRYKFEKIR